MAYESDCLYVLLKSGVDISDGPHHAKSSVGCVDGWCKTCCPPKRWLGLLVGRCQQQYG
jgi:hypothetical protein